VVDLIEMEIPTRDQNEKIKLKNPFFNQTPNVIDFVSIISNLIQTSISSEILRIGNDPIPFYLFFTADCVVYIIVFKRILSILPHSVHLFMIIIFPVMKRKKGSPSVQVSIYGQKPLEIVFLFWRK
jgi:hypothetical protein